MKTAFQIVLIVSNIVPLLTGILVALNGAAFFVDADAIDVGFDAQIRTYAVWFTGIFLLSVWIAFNIEIAGPVLKIVFTLVALAGLSRVYAMYSLGSYPPRTVVAAGIEIFTLIFIPWHAYVLKKMRKTKPVS
ncbi:MAG: DUF4345 domain-containing protein [Pseudomonadota bacterium]